MHRGIQKITVGYLQNLGIPPSTRIVGHRELDAMRVSESTESMVRSCYVFRSVQRRLRMQFQTVAEYVDRLVESLTIANLPTLLLKVI